MVIYGCVASLIPWLIAKRPLVNPLAGAACKPSGSARSPTDIEEVLTEGSISLLNSLKIAQTSIENDLHPTGHFSGSEVLAPKVSRPQNNERDSALLVGDSFVPHAFINPG